LGGLTAHFISDKIQKLRLGWYKALLGYSEPDLDRIIKAFIEWATFTEYLIFRKENSYTEESIV